MSARELITEHLDLWTGAVTKKSSRGRGSNGKVQLTGVKKLRELILELAVRGKLVEQDPTDEPASVLLENITDEKARLAKEGKINKTKTLPAITEQVVPFELPKRWQWTRIWDVSELITSGSRDWAKYYADSGAVFITMGNLSRGEYKLRLDNIRYVSPPAGGEGARTSLQAGDLVVSITGDVGNLGLIPEGFGEAYINQHSCLVRLSSLCRNRYYAEFLRSPCAKNQFDEPQRGVKNSFRLSDMGEMLISLPPLEEQHRIVQKVDELMALCDRLEQQTSDQLEAHETLVDTLLGTLTQSENATELAENWARLAAHFDTLFTTEQSIDKLKQSILQLAVMGRLVEQDAGDEPTCQLLERLSNEKQHLIKAKVLKRPKALALLDTSKLPGVPARWSWVNLGDIVSIMDAGWSPACSPQPAEPDSWGVLKTTAVQVMEYLEFENKKLPDSKAPKKQYEVRSGDILITRAGPKNRVGISCVVKETRDNLMISDKIIRFHLIEVGLSEEYICLCLNAGETYRYLEQAKSGMAESQMNISQDKLKAAPIPLCPANEQHRIVQKVDELVALCDQLKERLNLAGEARCQLAEAVMEQALS